ncbi:conserved hypothetical protein [Theileria equi strain WA]|uniref:MI domain-containing protein n=1 Tax=Theileria equi strain WA TaxID=1537102 RepID=L1LBT3_THEEQ|nr:conserved hypothetical protein [Theileria equi strain WA]EKX72897.1 conserved hypothetical protein [Theileria equi strain WA]|eukprot:XP_004832349.1 conserved hypothetical protein [Theileria equi strain WA]
MLPQVFYEHVIRDYKSASKELKKLEEDDNKVSELKASIKAFDDSVTDNLKVLKQYRENSKEYLDNLYGKNDIGLVLKFILNGNLVHLVHEFLLIYIGRGIISSPTNLEIVSITLEAIVGQTIPQSIVEIAFMRLMDTVSRNFPDDEEVGISTCNFLARSVIDGIISSSYLRTLRTLHAGRIAGYGILVKTLRWLDANTIPVPKVKCTV